MPNSLPFVDERRLVKCKLFLSSSPPPPIPLFALAPCFRATFPWLSLSPAKRKRKRLLRRLFPLRRQPLVFPTLRETASSFLQSKFQRIIFDYGYNWSDLIIPLNLSSCWHWSFLLTRDWPIVMPNCLPFVHERRLVKCKGSAAGFSFPPHPLPARVPLFALAPYVRATSPWLSLSPAKTPLRGNGKDCYAG